MQPHVDLPGDQMLLQGVTSDEGLSMTSRNAYAMRLRLLSCRRGGSILDIVTEARESLAWLRQGYQEVCTCKGSIGAVMAAIRRATPKFVVQLQKAQQLWLQELL